MWPHELVGNCQRSPLPSLGSDPQIDFMSGDELLLLEQRRQEMQPKDRVEPTEVNESMSHSNSHQVFLRHSLMKNCSFQMKYLIFKMYLSIKCYIFPGETGTYFEQMHF